MQTALGTWEQALVLPFNLVAEMVDDASARDQGDNLAQAATRVLALRGDPAAVAMSLYGLQEALKAYRAGGQAGQTLGELMEMQKEELAENVRTLVEAMETKPSEHQKWLVKNETGRVHDQLFAMRHMIVAQRNQAGTTKDGGSEPLMEEAQLLVSALEFGDLERAVYHASRLDDLRVQKLNRAAEQIGVGESVASL